jgi:hypothetical protein
MAGVAGRSGTNKGKDKPWTDALRLVACREDEESKKRLVKIAERCFTEAEQGNIQAIKEIGDRLDGKPAQAIIGGEEDDPGIKLDTRDLSRAVLEVLREAKIEGKP